MSSQDDPEARIRELEQPLATQGAVELGSSQYGGPDVHPPPPLPPPVHTDPYAASPYTAPPFGVSYPPAPRKGVAVGLVFGLIAVAVVVIFGGVGLVVWNVVSDMGSVSNPQGGTTVAGGGGSGKDPVGPTFDPPSVAPIIPEDRVLTAPAGASLSVAGVDEDKTVICDDNEVSVSGVNNTVTITGHCTSLTVSGVDNDVTVESVDTISASGFDNAVVYRSGDPQVDNSGGSNSVERG